MVKILYPAIALLNKLNYSLKFSVFGAIIISAFMAVSLHLISQINQTISTTETQLEGLDKIRLASLAVQAIQEHRGHSSVIKAVERRNGLSKFDHLSQLTLIQETVNSLFDEIEKSYPTELLEKSNWYSINSTWHYLTNKNSTMGLNNGFDSHTQLIEKLLAHQRLTADYYQLSIAPDLGAHYLLDTVLTQLPYSIETLGQLRAKGVTILARKQATTSQKDELNALILSLKRPLKFFKKNLRQSSTTNPQLEQSNKLIARNIGIAFNEVTRLIHSEVTSDLFTLAAKDYFVEVTKAINTSYGYLHGEILDNLRSVLDERIAHSKTFLEWNIAFLALILFIVIYVFVSISYSIISTTHHLSETAKRFASGDTEARVDIETSDELHDVGESFNFLAENMSELLKVEIDINRELQDEKSNLDAFFEHMDSGVAIYEISADETDFVFINVNQASENIEGRKRETLIGRTLTECFPTIKEFGLLEVFLQVWKTGQAQEHPLSLYQDQQIKSWRENYVYKLPNGHIVAIYKDVTQKKQSDDALELASLVYQNSTEAMMVTNCNNIIIAINPAFTEMTGYSEEDTLGHTPRILSSQKGSGQLYKALWNSLHTTGKWQGEIINKRKDGQEFIEWLSINTICNSDGSVYRYVALFSDITKKKETEQLVWQQANYDSLTRLPNRSMFRDRLEQAVKKSHRSQIPLALLFLDLDKFKEVNDSQGHDVGDDLLVQVAERITSCIRETDTVSRLGGDEFTVILPDLEDLKYVDMISHKILDALSETFYIDKMPLHISVSVGVTFYPNDAATVSELLKNADQAMYLAKEQGRNRFRYFTTSMQEQAQERLELLSDLRLALELDQLELYYQPIIDLANNNIEKAEALLRWNHPQRGMVSPADFIPIAEESGLIIEMGDWVFKQAVKQVKRCKDHYGIDVQISVNKSPVQFVANDDHDDWLEVLKDHGVSGKDVVIEITESLLLDNQNNILQQLHQFRDAGIEVSMDDFGTGYSSLSYLKKFDIDYLKIDQMFTRGLAPNSEDMILSEAIIVMAHRLGLKVIAEGVETEEQRALLENAGCDYGQGYHFSKPVPAKEFEELLQKGI